MVVAPFLGGEGRPALDYVAKRRKLCSAYGRCVVGWGVCPGGRELGPRVCKLCPGLQLGPGGCELDTGGRNLDAWTRKLGPVGRKLVLGL